MPCIAMSEKQSAYFQGLEDGWSLAWLRATDVAAYNEQVAEYNAELFENLNESEAMEKIIGPVPASNYTLPEIFK
jgi:hypothetical protein